MNRAPFVSVVIPALNEERYIGQCLSALKNIDYPGDRYEMIVVDNGSSDRTVSIAENAGALVVSGPRITISALRNLGVKRSRGEIIAFVDADCVVSPGWLKAALPHLDKKDVGAVGSRYRHPEPPHWIEEAWYAQVRDMDLRGPIRWLSGGNIVTRRLRFDEIGGFNEALRTNEDVEFCDRIRAAGYQIMADPDVRVIHLGNPKSLARFFKRELWYGQDIMRRFLASFPSLHNAKVVALGALFAVAIVLSTLLLLLASLGYGSSTLTIVTVGAIVGIPLAMAARHLPSTGRMRLLPRLWLLYLVYSVARGLTLLNPKNWARPR